MWLKFIIEVPNYFARLLMASELVPGDTVVKNNGLFQEILRNPPSSSGVIVY